MRHQRAIDSYGKSLVILRNPVRPAFQAEERTPHTNALVPVLTAAAPRPPPPQYNKTITENSGVYEYALGTL